MGHAHHLLPTETHISIVGAAERVLTHLWRVYFHILWVSRTTLEGDTCTSRARAPGSVANSRTSCGLSAQNSSWVACHKARAFTAASPGPEPHEIALEIGAMWTVPWEIYAY